MGIPDSSIELQPAPVALIPSSGSPLSELSDTSSDDDTLMEWSGSYPTAGSSPSPASPLKRKRLVVDHVLLSPLTALPGRKDTGLNGGPSPNKKLILETEYRDREAATSPTPNSASERDAFVVDMESCLDSILNQLADEAQRREALQEMYASGSYSVTHDGAEDADFESEANTALFLGSYDVSDDESTQNLGGSPGTLAPQESWRDLPSQILSELNSDFGLHDTVAEGELSLDYSALLLGEATAPPNDLENVRVADMRTSAAVEDDMEVDLPPSPSDEDDHVSHVEIARSRCPCNQCSPNAPTHPDSQLSSDAQQDIHRLFSLSPFAGIDHRCAERMDLVFLESYI
ncbi:hypothetical protein B0H15DRAFT_61585 [Mycena belliarum]|uniref:Uncharacterized protein n=1 Tax=Mycena belliarum TaxID=1033014 RepID=A0AAD6TP72_9AGAR|nr:hypothetical protein B0H15DRAFT_61585 [Mycena belliae]